MENDSLSMLLECIKTSSEIERSPYGQENSDVRVEEIFMMDILKFFVFLAFTTGEVHKKELKFINNELNYDFDQKTLKRYAEENVFPIDEFAYKVPLSFQYFLKAEYERNLTMYTTYRGICSKYIKTMRTVGREFIACDGVVSQEEIDNLNAFTKTLEEELNQWKGTDLYSRYGRHQISISGSEKRERTYAKEDNKKADKGNRRAVVQELGNMTIAESASNMNKAARLPEEQKQLQTEENQELDKLMKELNSMIGLDSVKQEVGSLVNKLNISKLREEQGLEPLPIEMHLVFTGNPGTGKTTVARLLAKIYYAMGILSKGQFVETDRSGLVAGYMGQTAEKVQDVVDSALGGVLFIDEAYSLSNGSKEDFGKEAIDTLVKAMEDHRDDLIVIVAGYTNEMKEFLNTNPGLESRFNTYINFEDYEAFDLVSILIGMCKKMQYALEPEAVKYVFHYFEEVLEHKTRNFGNARAVRNYMKHIMDKQINRITKEGVKCKMDLITIRLSDVQGVVLGGSL